MSGAGWTSYWVTTGPALRATIRAGIPKPASFLTMISSFRAWAASSPPAWSGTATSSRTVIGGRMYSMRSLVSGESLASVTSSGSRAGRSGTSVAEAAPRAGANVFDVWALLGIAVGIAFSSSPHAPVWPGDGAAGTVLPFDRPFLPFVATAAALIGGGGSLLLLGRRPAHRCRGGRAHPAGRADSRPGELSERDPEADDHAEDRQRRPAATNAPGAVTRSVRVPARARPIRPPGDAEDLRCARRSRRR